MKRMWSKNELKELIRKVVKEEPEWLLDGDVSIAGDLSVTGSINGEENPSVKPIYFHPVYIQDDTSGSEGRYTFFILDNNPTAYTFDTFKTKVKELMDADALIQVNGYFIKEATIFQIYILGKFSNSYRIYGVNNSGNRQFFDLDNITASQFADGVNKIN